MDSVREGHASANLYLTSTASKAFDKVDFSVTLRKLKQLGISGKLGRWLQAFLTGRTQTVIVNGAASRPGNAMSGVPQGSVIGPLLFIHWTTAVACPDRKHIFKCGFFICIQF